MSVIDQLKNLFAAKPPQSEADSRLSLAMPDQGADAEPPETVLVARSAGPSKPAPITVQAPDAPRHRAVAPNGSQY